MVQRVHGRPGYWVVVFARKTGRHPAIPCMPTSHAIRHSGQCSVPCGQQVYKMDIESLAVEHLFPRETFTNVIRTLAFHIRRLARQQAVVLAAPALEGPCGLTSCLVRPQCGIRTELTEANTHLPACFFFSGRRINVLVDEFIFK